MGFWAFFRAKHVGRSDLGNEILAVRIDPEMLWTLSTSKGPLRYYDPRLEVEGVTIAVPEDRCCLLKQDVRADDEYRALVEVTDEALGEIYILNPPVGFRNWAHPLARGTYAFVRPDGRVRFEAEIEFAGYMGRAVSPVLGLGSLKAAEVMAFPTLADACHHYEVAPPNGGNPRLQRPRTIDWNRFRRSRGPSL